MNSVTRMNIQQRDTLAKSNTEKGGKMANGAQQSSSGSVKSLCISFYFTLFECSRSWGFSFTSSSFHCRV